MSSDSNACVCLRTMQACVCVLRIAYLHVCVRACLTAIPASVQLNMHAVGSTFMRVCVRACA